MSFVKKTFIFAFLMSIALPADALVSRLVRPAIRSVKPIMRSTAPVATRTTHNALGRSARNMSSGLTPREQAQLKQLGEAVERENVSDADFSRACKRFTEQVEEDIRWMDRVICAEIAGVIVFSSFLLPGSKKVETVQEMAAKRDDHFARLGFL